MKQKTLENYSCLPCLAAIAILANSAHGALVAHYEFEETSGTALVDSSGNSNDGILQGSGDLNVTGQFGSGYAPGADAGAGNYGEIDNGVTTFGFGGNNSRTISLWFNTSSFNSGDPDDQFRLIGMGDGAGASFDIVAESNASANRVGLRYGNGNVFFDSDNSGTAFSVDTWYHLAVVYDGTNLDFETTGASDGVGLSFYVNGALVDIAGGNGNNGTQALVTSATDIAIGAKFDGSISSGASEGYPGLLDDVRFYDNALTSSEVAVLATVAVPEPSAVLLGGLGLLFMLRRRR